MDAIKCAPVTNCALGSFCRALVTKRQAELETGKHAAILLVRERATAPYEGRA